LSNTSYYHLDTCYLIDYLDEEAKDPHRHAKSVVDRLHSQDVVPEISEIAVGEFLRVAARDNYEESLVVDFWHHLKQNHFKVCRVEDPITYSQFVSEIRNADTWIEPNDVLIVAHSMATPECRVLLTHERKLIESTGLQKVRNSHGLSLRIADDTQ
jgi:predicted nucleic acid-binding protein